MQSKQNDAGDAGQQNCEQKQKKAEDNRNKPLPLKIR
jgi:hypothetical protein